MTLFEKLLGHTLITADNIWGLMGVMCIGVALSIFLEQKYQWASKVSGAIIGVIVFTIISYGLTFIGLNPNWQLIIKGLIIIAAVALDMRKNATA